MSYINKLCLFYCLTIPNDITCIYAAKGLAPFFYDIEKPDIELHLKSYWEKLNSCLSGRLGKKLVKAVKKADNSEFLRIVDKIAKRSGVPVSYDDMLREASKLMSPEVAKQEAELERYQSLRDEEREQKQFAYLAKAGIETNS